MITRSRRRDARSALLHLATLVGGAYVFVTSQSGILPTLVFSLALLDLVAIVTTIVHEGAHAVAGLATGFRIREISIGLGPKLAEIRLLGLRLIFRLLPSSGHTAFVPAGRAVRTKSVIMVLAGPLVHLPLAWAVSQIDPPDPSWEPFQTMSVNFILLIALLNLIPFGRNDGRTLVQLLKMPDAAVEVFVAVGLADATVGEINEAGAGQGSLSHDHRRVFLDIIENSMAEPAVRAIALNNLASTNLLLEDPGLLDESDQASEEAMDLLPEVDAIRNTRGSVLIAIGRFEEGIELLEPTLSRIQPQSLGNSHAWLAYGYASIKRVFEARRHIAASVATDYLAQPLPRAISLAGSLEVDVIRGYLAGRTPEEAVALMRTDAGPAEARTAGRNLIAYLDESGVGEELRPTANMLAES